MPTLATSKLQTLTALYIHAEEVTLNGRDLRRVVVDKLAALTGILHIGIYSSESLNLATRNGAEVEVLIAVAIGCGVDKLVGI